MNSLEERFSFSMSQTGIEKRPDVYAFCLICIGYFNRKTLRSKIIKAVAPARA